MSFLSPGQQSVRSQPRSRYSSCIPSEAVVCSSSPGEAPSGLCWAPTLTGVTGDPGARRQHTVLLGVIWPRGGDGIKALSWPAREMDSAGEAQKDILVLRTEAAMSPSTEVPELLQWWEAGGSCLN